MPPSPSARLSRPTGRPRVPNAGPAKVLALWPAVALAPGRLAERVWHRQTRLDERFQAWGERLSLVTAVANARRERAPLLLLAPFTTQVHANLRMLRAAAGGYPRHHHRRRPGRQQRTRGGT